ncbi:hypothetical protein GOODEAATRI_005011 [Goodea atripinnis]|uniref:G-protein coupled receptors family 2 profile 2 domain-containing protein n=1 Tax=Goodea atripinnis TaxID=208336 RepID=A0ABV0MYT7_9TELE
MLISILTGQQRLAQAHTLVFSKVVSVVVSNPLTQNLSNPVNITFRHLEPNFDLQLLTKIGLIISLVCLALSILTFKFCRSIQGTRTTVHLHLCICLFMADLIFLVGISRTRPEGGCTLVAAMLHFFFLSVMTWMLLEGVQLYRMVVLVFNATIRPLYLYLTGYGVPLGIVIISLIIRPGGYGTNGHKGMTVVAYIFTILNSLQGALIFIMHCLLSKQVRDEYGQLLSCICPTQKKRYSDLSTTNPSSSQSQVWSFKELQERCNAVAHWALAQGWAEGDVVALYMENHPLVVALWLGLAMVGVEAAFINYNLRQQPLLHCVGVSGARAMVFGAEMTKAVSEVAGSLQPGMVLFCTGDEENKEELCSFQAQSLEALLTRSPTHPPNYKLKKDFNDRLFYIYTSGTTGMPKAAIVVHSRYFRIAAFGFHSFGLRPDDIVYNCLPLYHSAGRPCSV